MTLPMARDLGKYGIRVLDIAPSVFLTPMATSAPPALLKASESIVPIKRLGQVDEFAHLAIA